MLNADEWFRPARPNEDMPMRHPGWNAILAFLAMPTGLAFLSIAIARVEAWGNFGNTMLAGGGLVAIVMGSVLFLISWRAASGRARLLSGGDVIARWQLTPAQWERFRTLDTARGRQAGYLVNDFHFHSRPTTKEVQVTIGTRGLIIDGSYYRLSRHGYPRLGAVSWLNAPADPECIEFLLYYPKVSVFETRRTLRIPVPASSREDGVRVFRHFERVLPEPRQPIAYRRPRLVLGYAAAIAVAGAIVSAAGWIGADATDSDLQLVMAVLGSVLSLGAVMCALLIALVLIGRWMVSASRRSSKRQEG